MKLKNISAEEQRVMPHTGPAFSCAADESVEIAELCGEELIRSFPSVWEAVEVKPKKTKPGSSDGSRIG